MKMAEIMDIFRNGQNDARKQGAVTQGECDVAGIVCVVKSLRNDGEFLKTWEEAKMADIYSRLKI